MSEMIIDYLDYQRITTPDNDSTDAEDLLGPSPTPLFMRSAINELSSISAAFLVSSSPIQSTSAPPAFQPSTISPSRSSRYSNLLAQPTMTEHEQNLCDGLIESETRDVM